MGNSARQFDELSSTVILRTERLRLCRPHIELAEALTTALNASYALHQPFLAWARGDWTVEESRQRLRTAASEFDTQGRERRYYLLDGAGQVAGCVGLTARQGHHELGYWASASHARQGYLSEALQLLLAPFDSGQLMLTTSSLNLASQGLAEALGFACRERRAREHASEGEITLVYWR